MILYFDADETLDPYFNENIFSEINRAIEENSNQLRFTSTIEILPNWKMLRVDDRIGGCFGFVWGDARKIRREEYFDGNFRFKSPVQFSATGIPLYHLHHFRKKAMQRILNDNRVFTSGGIEYDISNCPELPETNYISELKKKFANNFTHHLQSPNSYLGFGLEREFMDEVQR